ncbi:MULTISPECIES: ABC transporter permease subunit [unclassified Nocardioides]|uniref:ABC transporter permease subunit n=1 Tax=unclassified Nocardioides TaxID=2615069 RepID=UPI00114ECDC7|nr:MULTISPECIES: ABC transporter permease subunit [unclassified Nocardioides]TQK72981.1 ABC-type transport system involved in multi-copper enzyme maturation permease subunit [Nocardioides sp. SLBN-35]WGY02779.1 ABC transporter permease subunit [Nocardioides sp. QY071]
MSTVLSTTRSTRAELMRLRAWPAVWITLGAWLVLSMLFGYLFTYLSYTSGDPGFTDEGTTQAQQLAQMMPDAVPDVFLQGMPMFGGALMMVLGALVAGNGYGWGTWKTLFSQGVRRTPALVGSVLSLTAIVVGTLVVTFALDLGISVLIATTESQDVVMPSLGSVGEAFGAGFLVLEMWALLGFLLGTLARGPALSVGLGLVWALVVENLLRGVGQLLGWVESLTEVLPGTSAGSLIGSIVGVGVGDGTPGVVDTVPGTQAAITVAVYVALAVLGSIALVRRRDVT